MQNQLLDHLLFQLAEPFTGEALFDGLTDLVFFLKNERGEYVLVNHTLASRCGVSDKSVLIGQTAADVFPHPLGASYLAQDLALIESGEALLNELELHMDSRGDTGWCLTTKLPLTGRDGRRVGLVGMSRDLHALTEEYRDIAAALRQAQAHLDSPLSVEELARLADLSAYQFDRRIREVFHLSASQLLLKFRMDLATQRLRDTSDPIAHIALICGYSDQSAFTRQFRRTTGLTPGEYRKRTEQ